MSLIRVFKATRGENNKEDPWKLRADELSAARNVDIDARGKVTRRNGFTEKLTGNFKDLWADRNICLAVLSGNLVRITVVTVNNVKTYQTAIIRRGVGTNDMKYVAVNETVFYTNGNVIGYITDGVDNSFSDPGITYKRAPLPGHIIEYWNGRLLIARGNVIEFTDATKYNRVDNRRGFKPFPTEIRMIAPVSTGLFVSDETKTYYVAGLSEFKKHPITEVANYPALKGSPYAQIDGELLPEPMKGKVVAWTAENGICIGSEGGEFFNATENRFIMPEALKCFTVFVRKTTGLNQIIAATVN